MSTIEKRIDALSEDLIKKINEFGFAIIGVYGSTQNVLYTVGLVEVLGYEMIATTSGSIETTHIVMNQFIEELKNNEASPTDDIVYPARLRDGSLLRGRMDDVTTEQAVVDFMTINIAEYGIIPKIYQLVLADKNNILPSEPNYDVNWVQTIQAL